MTVRVIEGDCTEVLRGLESGAFQCCVTSPPYYGLRDYGVAGQLGIEPTSDDYVTNLVAVFREVRRVLRDDGTLWLNIGDSYHNPRTHMNGGGPTNTLHRGVARAGTEGFVRANKNTRIEGVKDKDLIGIPWLLAFALRADGWWLRSDIIWHKPNPMPESARDRPTSAHEHVFLLTKSSTYYYDAEAIREPPSHALLKQIAEGYSGRDTKDYAAAGAQSPSGTKARIIANARAKVDKQRGHSRRHAGFNGRWDAMSRDEQTAIGSNARNVWTIAPESYRGAHFAVMPSALAARCIKAGTRPGDTVLDPFGGAGTTGLAADRLQRNALLIELNHDYAEQARSRIRNGAPLLADVA